VSLLVSVQEAAFDVGAEYGRLREHNSGDGATAIFVGSVRDLSDAQQVAQLQLEHYPGMTERVLEDIAAEARERWQLGRVRIVHRVGSLGAGEDIVFVGTCAPHRRAALEACAFVIDVLKTRAPFWKKEVGPCGGRWVEARQSDRDAVEKW